jgi:hypothetical protein
LANWLPKLSCKGAPKLSSGSRWLPRRGSCRTCGSGEDRFVGVDVDASSGELARTRLLSILCKLLMDVVELEGEGTGEGVNRSAEKKTKIEESESVKTIGMGCFMGAAWHGEITSHRRTICCSSDPI